MLLGKTYISLSQIKLSLGENSNFSCQVYITNLAFLPFLQLIISRRNLVVVDICFTCYKKQYFHGVVAKSMIIFFYTISIFAAINKFSL